MPSTQPLRVEQLTLDLANFRTMPQRSQTAAIRTMISINPDWFWALTESLLDENYHPTENILVLKDDSEEETLVVKEGNRRIGALKLILGHVRRDGIDIPSNIEQKIKELSLTWKKENETVPCAVYESSEAATVDRIITLIHGKGEKAGRDRWKAVARARHSRDKNGASEPALDLLEKYIESGKNVTTLQKDRWSGDYPLTVLEEAIKRLATRVGASSARDVSDRYPTKLQHRASLERIMLDIGLEQLGFEAIRDKTRDVALAYGIPALATNTGTGSGDANSSASGGQSADGTDAKTGGQTGSAQSASTHSSKVKAVALDDPKAVTRRLKHFTPAGENREKLVTLIEEARTLKPNKHPHAFCFLLRSMFEISAKAYCIDHAIPTTNKDGDELTLAHLLREITSSITNGKKDKAATHDLHGAMAELGRPEGLLSVTSMNQLVHNPRFSVNAGDICRLFGNIFPLLEAMNR